MTYTVNGLSLSGGATFYTGNALGSTASTVTPSTTAAMTVAPSSYGSPYWSNFAAPNCYNFPTLNSGSTTADYNYITIAANSAYSMGRKEYTVEWFQYQTNYYNYGVYFWTGTGTAPTGFYPSAWGMYASSGYPGPTPPTTNAQITLNEPGFHPIASAVSPATMHNAWRHFAIVRSYDSGLWSSALYIDGVFQGENSPTAPWDMNISGQKIFFGSSDSYDWWWQFSGSMTGFRLTIGKAVYTGNFTKPWGPLAQTQSANPYGGVNTAPINSGECVLLLNP